jgi:aryl-alcohol dehydrogenase-like predicted oxidoreductase
MTFGRESDESESIRMVDMAIDMGINLFDTANSYSQGKSEEILGKALKGRRDRVVLATKYFNKLGDGPNDKGASRYHIVRAVEQSLLRLKTDRIDIYQQHRFDPETPLEETLAALNDLIRAGKVVYIGCSNFSAAQLSKAIEVARAIGPNRFVSVQPMYNILKPEAEKDLFPLCRQQGIGIIPYNPLAGGFLTGKYKSHSKLSPKTRLAQIQSYRERYLSDENFVRVSRFINSAQKRGVDPIALAIAWVTSHPAVTSPLLGARNCDQLLANMKHAELTIDAEGRALLTKEVWNGS